jgi:hypothetical protein
MRFAKRLLMGVGAAALVAILGMAVAPKAARGLVATLVQVSNTASNPAIAQGVPSLASQNVIVLCELGLECLGFPPTGHVIPSGSYKVPAGQTLIITNIEPTSNGGGGTAVFELDPDPAICNNVVNECVATDWNFSNDGLTHEFQLSPGIPLPSGGTIFIAGKNWSSAWVRGYLTSN